jgi:colicin import membrane protein
MKKVYVIFPTVFMLIFFGYWWNFSSEYEAKEAAKKEIVRQDKIAKLEQEALNRKKAIEDALANQDIRRQVRATKEAKRQADLEQRQADKETRRQADREKQKFARQVSRLESDVDAEKQLLTKVDEKKRVLIDEEAFLREYVDKARSNENSVTKVIQRLVAADAARAAAVAAAVAAQKKS